tara:strand:- start:495 stop:665 length:171 start_codon:yes stop_codon:yes gene_type:complete
MYLIIKRIEYKNDKDSFSIVNGESFKDIHTANTYAMHLGDSNKRDEMTYTVIKLGE